MDREKSALSRASRAFESKVLRAKWALVFEQIWRRLWVLLGLLGVFALLSLAGVWSVLGETLHQAVVAAFGLAVLAWLVFAARIRIPTRDESIRRIERVSGIPHRPASSYEDTLSASATDPTTQAIWQAHRARMAEALGKLKAGIPRPRTYRADPYALRILLALLIVLGTAFLGARTFDRLADAFRFGALKDVANARLDAWITPPAYTAKPPIMLADGAQPIGKADEAQADAGPRAFEVPTKSVVIVRTSGTGSAAIALEVTPDGGQPETLKPAQEKIAGDVSEVRHEVTRPANLRVLAGGNELAAWRLTVIPDALPTILLTKKPEQTPRGSMKVTYKAIDDYGVASAEVNLERLPEKPIDPSQRWAAPEPLTGPRPPLRRPPSNLALRLPQPNAKEASAFSYFEFGSHPWAGQKVVMTLVAKDVGGQTGRSEPVVIVLPERRFTKPLARAVIEQRRKLVEDPRYREQVLKALDALTLEPDGFIEDSRVFLGLRSIYYRLQNDRTRAAMDSSVEQLWHIALKIEDGDLSDAERALRDAQDKLAKALEEGASDEEIKQLMQEMKQAFNNYMEQLAKEREGQEQDFSEGNDEQNQMLNQQDLERMMQEMEDAAKNGSREQAQQMLAEMRDLVERMQSGKTDQKHAEQNKSMQDALKKLKGVAGEQQELMDETYLDQQNEGDQGAQDGQKPGGQGERAGRGKQGQKGQGKQGQSGEGAQGLEEPGDSGQSMGQNEEGGQSGQGQQGRGKLAQRQRELRERLEQLQRDMREKGLGSSDQLDEAADAMKSAEDALEQGDMGEATEQQARALDQMRQGSQSMAQQMMKNMPQRFGQSGDSPRDPLGRPQRTQGPDQGTSVKVPDQIDMQRAREILEELRRRLGEASRPTIELDYLERLLRRF